MLLCDTVCPNVRTHVPVQVATGASPAGLAFVLRAKMGHSRRVSTDTYGVIFTKALASHFVISLLSNARVGICCVLIHSPDQPNLAGTCPLTHQTNAHSLHRYLPELGTRTTANFWQPTLCPNDAACSCCAPTTHNWSWSHIT